jgi:isopentenyldiphosphate isomerase
MEYFDVLDCAGRKTGERIERDAAHAGGIWHGAFHCCMVYPQDGAGCALFQLRSRAKRIAPGKFDVSVGGHYAAGEGPEGAGPREIREELGLVIPFGQLVPVGKRTFVYCFAPGLREYEFQDVFLLPMAGRPGGLELQPEEVDGVLELDIVEGIRLFTGQQETAEGRFIGPGGDEAVRAVTTSDFVPCLDNYYCRLLVLARRYFAGERQALVI